MKIGRSELLRAAESALSVAETQKKRWEQRLMTRFRCEMLIQNALRDCRHKAKWRRKASREMSDIYNRISRFSVCDFEEAVVAAYRGDTSAESVALARNFSVECLLVSCLFYLPASAGTMERENMLLILSDMALYALNFAAPVLKCEFLKTFAGERRRRKMRCTHRANEHDATYGLVECKPCFRKMVERKVRSWLV